VRFADARVVLAVVMLSAVASSAEALARPPAAAAERPAPVLDGSSQRGARSARLLGEGVTVAAAGVVLPVAAYAGLTAGLQSFTGFFAGIATATLLGVVVAPIAVIIASQLLGLRGGVGRGVVGALIGLAVGLLVGLPLATLPSALYVVGLVVLWALPSAGAMVGLEWGQAPAAVPTGVTVARF
jgi:hypothetical protein